jgi:hypothetical protein
MGGVWLPPPQLGCIFLPMSFRPVRKIAGIGNVFLGTELVDIAEYELEIYEENPEDHEHGTSRLSARSVRAICPRRAMSVRLGGIY